MPTGVSGQMAHSGLQPPLSPGVVVPLLSGEADPAPVLALGSSALSSGWMEALQAAIAQAPSLEGLLKQCVATLTQTLAAQFVYVWVFNAQSGLLELQIASETIAQPPFPDRIPPGISIIGLTAQNQEPYIAEQLSQTLWIAPADWIRQEALTSFAAFPLVVAGQLVGVLAFFRQQPITPDIRQIVSWGAGMIASAIAFHRSQIALESRQETVLYRLASQIQNSLDLDTILAVAVQEIQDIFQIDRCNFLWCWTNLEINPETGIPALPIIAVTHEAKADTIDSLLGECSSEQVSVLAQKILTLTGIHTSDARYDDSLDEPTRHLLETWDLQACLLLPVETRNGQLGAILCGHTGNQRPWSSAEMELLQAIADQVAIAINQAELHAQTRASAFAAQTQARQLSEALDNLKQTQTKLIQSEKMSSLGQLVAGIAHEINNPVNFISGNINYAQDYFHSLLELLELYQQHYPDPPAAIQNYLEDIDLNFLLEDLEKLLRSMQVGADRICQIVLSLRNFSRLDEAELKPVNIHEGLDNTLLILHNRLRSKGDRPEIEIVKEYGELPQVECFAGPLNQVFMNLLGNAIDALEEQPSPRCITIRTEAAALPLCDAKEIPGVRICIRDNGPGIPAAIQSRLFEPFFTTKPVGKGTGLGLAISYQIIVERHQGSLNCFSQPGEGSEFILEIPTQRSCAT
ncbi:MAG TPA: GAF domain-containing protein [Leptolyngbyaceae cyanobacterium]